MYQSSLVLPNLVNRMFPEDHADSDGVDSEAPLDLGGGGKSAVEAGGGGLSDETQGLVAALDAAGEQVAGKEAEAKQAAVDQAADEQAAGEQVAGPTGGKRRTCKSKPQAKPQAKPKAKPQAKPKAKAPTEVVAIDSQDGEGEEASTPIKAPAPREDGEVPSPPTQPKK